MPRDTPAWLSFKGWVVNQEEGTHRARVVGNGREQEMAGHKGQGYLAACQRRTMNKSLKVWENTFYPEDYKSEAEEIPGSGTGNIKMHVLQSSLEILPDNDATT